MTTCGRNRLFWPAFLLAAACLALYWPATRFDYVALDDDQYVYDNPWVAHGLSWSTAKWACTTTSASNWHPVTWLSHLLDSSIYGPLPFGPHLTNILLHAVNAVLLYLVLARLTAAPWPALLAAALFALHPLRVESVAWISERKDLLCGLFWMLTLWAWVRYAEKWRVASGQWPVFYGLSLVFFALGLMSKPMMVTLPFVLVLLDYWPLQRAHALKEKWPFFALAAVSCVITVIAQHASGAIKSVEQVSFLLRAANAPVACLNYVGKTLWPSHLCAFYPLPAKASILAALGAVSVLAVITVLAIRWRQRCPWLMVGWFWFLGTLVPVIGLLQVGGQGMADRYTYLPSIGLCIMLAWSAQHGLARLPAARAWIGGAALLCLLGCVLAAERQLSCWRDSLALFGRIVSFFPGCASAQNGLGLALSNAGRRTDAIQHYKDALRLDPVSVHARYNLGIELANAGQLDEAVVLFSEAIKLSPRNELLRNNLGTVLARQGKVEAALEQFQRSIELNSRYPKPYFNSGMALERLGRWGQAATNYQLAIQLDPNWPEPLDRLSALLATGPDPKQHAPRLAIQLALRANALTQSRVPGYLQTLAAAYASASQFSNAVSTAELARHEAQAGNLTALAGRIEADLRSYKAGHTVPSPPESGN